VSDPPEPPDAEQRVLVRGDAIQGDDLRPRQQESQETVREQRKSVAPVDVPWDRVEPLSRPAGDGSGRSG
jgi:hypothetical protein